MMRSIKVAKLQRFFTLFAILFLAACTTPPEIASETPLFTITSETTATIDFGTATREITPIPTESETPIWTPTETTTPLSISTITDTAIPFTSQTPTATPQFPITVRNEMELRICTQIHGAVCDIDGLVILTSQLLMQTSGVTVRGGSITNDVSYPDRLVMIARTTDVHLESVTIYGTLAQSGSVIKDCLLIVDSAHITLKHVTLMWCEDENLDITNSTDIEITNSVIMQPLRCALHKSGCHGLAILVVRSTIAIQDSVICCANGRMPQAQYSTVSLNRVLLGNFQGHAVEVVCGGTVITNQMIVRGGLDTADAAYAIVSPHGNDCIVNNEPSPQITEKCSLVLNWHIASDGRKYPRVRRPGDKAWYINPLIFPNYTEFLSDKSDCIMPTESDVQAIIQNAGSLLTPACLLAGDCRILDVPPS